jgi:hypothetical protein
VCWKRINIVHISNLAASRNYIIIKSF